MISLYYLITKPTHWLKFLQCSWGAEWLQVTFQLQAALGIESAATKYILGIPHSGIPKVWTASLPALGTVLPAALAASRGGSAPSLPKGPALAVPAVSPCVLVAFFPPSKLVLQSFLFPALVLVTQDHSGREACAHHLSRTRASLICWSGVSGEAATGWFLRNKKQLHGIFTPSV